MQQPVVDRLSRSGKMAAANDYTMLLVVREESFSHQFAIRSSEFRVIQWKFNLSTL